MRFALVLVYTALLAAQSPLDYTQWRGVSRDGAASGFAEPREWPDRLTRKWKIDVGQGYGTPLVVGNTVYTFTRIGDTETLTALNADSGERLWSTGYPAAYTPSPPAAAHGAGPKATPLFHKASCSRSGSAALSRPSIQSRGRSCGRPRRRKKRHTSTQRRHLSVTRASYSRIPETTAP